MELPIPVVGLVPLVIYLLRLSGEKLLTQLFSIENNLFCSLERAYNSGILKFSEFSILDTHIKMDKVFREPKELVPITHKEFNEFIRGEGFTGRNNYKLKDLKAMFGFKPMITGSSVTISSNGLEPTRFDSMSKASTSTGIPYATLLYAKRNSRSRIHSNGKEYVIKFITS